MVLSQTDCGFEHCFNISIFQYFPDEIPALIGSSETNIESEIVYKAPGAEEREPTIEIVEIEENVNVLRENDGGRGWGGTRGEGRRRQGRKRQRPGRQKEKEEEELDNKEEEEEERRRGKEFRSYEKNLFRSSASQNYPVALSPILILLHSQSKSCFY